MSVLINFGTKYLQYGYDRCVISKILIFITVKLEYNDHQLFVIIETTGDRPNIFVMAEVRYYGHLERKILLVITKYF